MSRPLILLGLAILVVGLLWGPITRLGLARLPGDIVIERENSRLYFPITSGILISVVLSVAIALLRAFLSR